MDILAFVPAYVGYDHNAGAELTMHEMLVALRLRGHKVTVLLSQTIPDNQPYVIDGIKVQTYASRRDLNYMAPEADLLISHLECAERVGFVGAQLKKPVVQLIHNNHHTAYQSVEAGCDLAVFNTDWIGQAFSSYRLNSLVLHPPIRAAAYAGERGKAVTLVNLWRNKGPELFYALAERNPKVEFIGVRGGYQEQDVREMDNVTILENTGDIREVYKRTKVVLMPSAYESFGRVAIEAAASGIPTLASPTPGLKEALDFAGTFCDAPQVNVPGAHAPDWTEEQIDEWDKALKKMLSPAGYGKASKKAKEISEHWDEVRTDELEEFCQKVEGLV